MDAVFSFPTTVVFGAGSIARLADRFDAIGASRPMVVTDAGLVRTPVFGRAVDQIARVKHVFSDVRPNPHEADVEAGASAFVAHDCDSVIAIGGGSAIDVAKALRLRVKLPQWNISEALPKRLEMLAPFVAIPTTAGTGSEVGRSSVVTVGESKRVIFHPSLLANLVVLDPELTVDLPAKLTAATGADALTHCIESYTSPVFHPLCEAIALEGIHLVAKWLPIAVAEPKNIEARGEMQIAAMMGGIAFQKDLGAAHSLAHPLSALCGLHHGLANALVLPSVMKFNASRKPGLYRRVGEAMGVKDATDDLTIAAVESLLRQIGIAPGLMQHGVDESKLDALADQAFADGCHPTNAVPVTRQDLLTLYQQAMG